jgi:hypothetical protein
LPAGYRELSAVGSEANSIAGLPNGYRRVVDMEGDIVIMGPRGGIYKATDYVDGAGNPLYSNGGKTYAMEGGQTTFVPAGERVVPKSGFSLSQSQIDNIVNTPKGKRPDPSEYMTKADIDAHLAIFDDGAVRFTSKSAVEKYGTAGNSEAFVMPKSEFDKIVSEAGGNLRVIEQRLGLDSGYLSNKDVIAVHIKRQDMPDIKVPSGNESGANSQWRPGGYTSGGVPEAVVDLSRSPFSEISY